MAHINGRLDQEWIARATLAYVKEAAGTFREPDLALTSIHEVDGLHYVAVRDTAGEAIAWYRIQNSGQLRRMVRGPRGHR